MDHAPYVPPRVRQDFTVNSEFDLYNGTTVLRKHANYFWLR